MVNDLPIVKVVQLLNSCLGILFTLDPEFGEEPYRQYSLS